MPRCSRADSTGSLPLDASRLTLELSFVAMEVQRKAPPQLAVGTSQNTKPYGGSQTVRFHLRLVQLWVNVGRAGLPVGSGSLGGWVCVSE